MSISFVSVINERELFGNPSYNVVAFSRDTDIFDKHANLLQAADIIQARYLYASFLLEASHADRGIDMESLDDAFEVSVGSNLFCVPFAKRSRLPDPDIALTDFATYCKLFDALRLDADTNPETVWNDCYKNRGLITFRLILSKTQG